MLAPSKQTSEKKLAIAWIWSRIQIPQVDVRWNRGGGCNNDDTPQWEL